MSFKKIISASLMALVIVPFASNASLTISNQTKHDSTTIVNSGFCSTKILGKDGITKPGETKVISDLKIRLACMTNLENCRADVYMTGDCTGDIISTVIFSIKTGIKSVSPPKDGYSVSYSPFSITVSGGPAKA